MRFGRPGKTRPQIQTIDSIVGKLCKNTAACDTLDNTPTHRARCLQVHLKMCQRKQITRDRPSIVLGGGCQCLLPLTYRCPGMADSS
eukprot:2218601-Heterocapsa_arctica.AAC.1